MPVERRLRQGLGRNADDLDPKIEAMLVTVVSRARRRVFVRRVTSAMAIGMAIAVAIAFGPGMLDLLRSGERNVPADSPHPSATLPAFDQVAGTYSTTVTGKGTTSGTWTIQLRGDGTMAVTAPSTYAGAVSGFQFDVSGDRFRTDAFIGDLCSGLPPGLYRWERSRSMLTLTPLQDTCGGRVKVLSSVPWTERS